ncbi:aldo/keto reductase [Curtobacterium ammoniigenes]|uniref:aldo/keto reductase n=1 Tax=Curtobacterium ammoniigenes TaxID=395387 RepID=UPI000AF0E347|nr:aldo/keto reductase [Curtobacterium ammoniigenes]
MQYRRASGSGLTLPELSLGLWHNFGTDRDLDTQRAIVLRAFDLGITHFDLANNYGPPPGAAEETFGRILRRDLHRYRDEIVIATKAGYRMWEGPYGDGGSRKSMLASLHQSLSRLGVEYVDIFYSHRPDPNTPIEETMGALTRALQSGKALYPALSNYDAEQTRAAQSALTRNGTPAVLHQTRYSMLDRTYEHTLQHVLTELSIGTTVFSPLAQGLLTDRYLGGGTPDGSRATTSPFLHRADITQTYLRTAHALNALAAERAQTLSQFALTWVLRDPAVTSAIIGASSVEQLEQNMHILTAPPLSTAELAAIEMVLQ